MNSTKTKLIQVALPAPLAKIVKSECVLRGQSNFQHFEAAPLEKVSP